MHFITTALKHYLFEMFQRKSLSSQGVAAYSVTHHRCGLVGVGPIYSARALWQKWGSFHSLTVMLIQSDPSASG